MPKYEKKEQSTAEQSNKKKVDSFVDAKLMDCKQFNQMQPIQQKSDSECDDSSREVSTSDEHSNGMKQELHKIGSFSFDPVLEGLITSGVLTTSNQVFNEDRTFWKLMDSSTYFDHDNFTREEAAKIREQYDEDITNAYQTNEVEFGLTENSKEYSIKSRSETIGGNIIDRLLKTMVSCEYFKEITEEQKHAMIDGYMSGYLKKEEAEEIEQLCSALDDKERLVKETSWRNLMVEGTAKRTARNFIKELLALREQIDTRIKAIEREHKDVNEKGKQVQKDVYFQILSKAVQDIGGYICQLNIVDYFSVFGIKDWVDSKWAFLQDVNLFLKANPNLLDLSKKEDQQFLFMLSFMNTFQGASMTAASCLGEESFPGEATADKQELHQLNESIEPLLLQLSYLIHGLKQLGISVPQLTIDQQEDYNRSRLERAQAYREKHNIPENKKILESNADIIEENMDYRNLEAMGQDVQKRLSDRWLGVVEDNTIQSICAQLYMITMDVQNNENINDRDSFQAQISQLIFSFQSVINKDTDRTPRKEGYQEDIAFFKEFLMKVFLSSFSDKMEHKPHQIESFSFDPVLESWVEDKTLKTSEKVFDKDRKFGQMLERDPSMEETSLFHQEQYQRLTEEYTEDLSNTLQTNTVSFIPTIDGVKNQSKTITGNVVGRLLITMEGCEYFKRIGEDEKCKMINGYMSGYLTKDEKETLSNLSVEFKELADKTEQEKVVSCAEDNLSKVEKTKKLCTLNEELLEKRNQIEEKIKEIEQAHKETNKEGNRVQKNVYFRILKDAIQDIGGYICQLNTIDYFSVFGIKKWLASKWTILQDTNQFLKANPQLLDLSKKEDQQFLFMLSFLNRFQEIWTYLASDVMIMKGQMPSFALELYQIPEEIDSMMVELSYLMEGLERLGITVPKLTPEQQKSYDDSRGKRARACRRKHKTSEDKKILESHADIIQEGMDRRNLGEMAQDVQNRLICNWKFEEMKDDFTRGFIGELYDIAFTVEDNRNMNDTVPFQARISELLRLLQPKMNDKRVDDMLYKHPEDTDFFRKFLIRVFLEWNF